MRKLLTLALVVTAFMAKTNAQDIVTGKSMLQERMYPVSLPAVRCGGQANMQSAIAADGEVMVNTLPKQFMENAPRQAYIDSIKTAWLLIKERQADGRHTAAKTTTVTPDMGHNFAGNTFAGVSPLDNSIAVSNGGYIVSVSNSKIAFYTTSGTPSYNNAITAFLPASFGATAVTNPVVLYDPSKDRFIFVCQQYPVVDTGKLYICFSQSNNPGGGWWCYALYGSPSGSGDGFDFPRIAVNDSELFITGNLYTSPGTSSSTFDKVMIYQMDKLAGYAGASLSSVYYNYVAGTPFSLLPVSSVQPAGIATGMYMLCTNQAGGSSIYLYHIIGNWCCTPYMTFSTLSTSSYSVPANAHQSGTTDVLKTGDCRIQSGFYLNGIIHYAFNCNASTGYSGINYNRLNLAANTNTSSVFSAVGYDCAYPAIASYAASATDLSVMVGYGRVSASIYPEIRVVNCDSAMNWSGSTLVKASASYVSGTSGVAGWGDYTGMARKHNSAIPSVWMNGMFGNAAHNWDTWIAEIHDSLSSPCPQPDTLSVTGITATAATLHWNATASAATYNIQYRPSTTTTWASATSSTTTKALTGLTPATHYEFHVQTRCFGTDSSLYGISDTFTTLTLPNAINSVSKNNATQLFPNPVKDYFSVSIPLATDCGLNIAVKDITGRLVKVLFEGKGATGTNEFTFRAGSMPAGVYFLVVKADGKVVANERMVIVP